MTRTTHAPAIAALLGLTMLGGCAKLNTVHRTKPVSSTTPTVITIDAKQRHLLMVPEMVPATTRTITADGRTWEERITTQSAGGMRVCAEAAPDVFSAMAASGTLDLSAGAKSPSGGANIGAGFAASETAAAIRRTQTVNLARESFYRTCERYLSGAIGKTAFGVQAARDFRQAIAMLAIEQLTGVLQGPSTIISAGSTNAAQTNPEEYYRQLQASSTKLAEAKATLASAKAAADPAKKTCKAEDGESPEDKKTREAECAAKEAAVKSAETAVDAAQRHHEALMAMSKNGAPMGGMAAATAMGNVTPDGGTQAVPAHVADVAKAVQTIALKAMDTDETLMFCLQSLSNIDANLEENTRRKLAEAGNQSVQERCLLYMAADVKAETTKKIYEAERNIAIFLDVKSILAEKIRLSTMKEYKTIRTKVRRIDENFCRLPGKEEFTPAQCADRLQAGEELDGTSWSKLPTQLLAVGISITK